MTKQQQIIEQLEALTARVVALETAERERASWEPCPGCMGSGQLETECCSGASGCSCRGQMVYLGACQVCGGHGQVKAGQFDSQANINLIRASMSSDGYLGSGARRW